ncbi:MAG: DUF3391 domain-containing protein [Nitrospirae bacterium]|nr:DUF3391 domain-containing protein [Nitrospirota bacterium]MBF0534205.1 DUF3391 domain-containing protein [Nitrospirota bacterium]MBF0615881.1 DUF3391 domain-containing protein [Nitrospirota bacterium]
MIKKIPIEELCVGMYVDSIDEKWIQTPFLLHHFSVTTQKQIAQIKELGIKHVHVDTGKSSHLNEVSEVVASNNLEDKSDKLNIQPLPYTQEELTKYYHDINLFTHIDRDTLIKGALIDFSLYIKKDIKVHILQKYEGKNIEITDSLLSTEGDIAIEKESTHKYRNYLNDLSGTKSLSEPDKFKHIRQSIIRENSKILMHELLDDPRCGDKIKECRGSVEEIVDTIEKNGIVIKDLLTINKYDYYTYTHSVNVCVLSIGLALSLGTFTKSEIHSIGMGALLHDIGKSSIPVEILNKPSMLNEKEYSIMRQHVLMANKILSEQKILLNEIYHPVMEHHEKLTGGGYPKGLTDSQIHPWGKLVSLIDAYDALTTARPYKRAFSPFEALSVIRQQLNDFDHTYFVNLVKILGSITD